MPILADNRRAFHDYDIKQTFEAGIVLLGHEVKAARDGHISLKGAYAIVRDKEAWLLNAHISPYKKAGPLPGYDPTRSRKLLLHRQEIASLLGKLQSERLTLVPLKIYTSKRRLKISLGLGKGKKMYEKREAIKKRDVEREIRRSLKV
jgi:SsrA-binding protein